ncbi:MAG: YerC/YecD family TrpR-related protein [Robiginitomaculum sp.]|nr:YerC/YecD family TrpR-related protein [Robiginitomaculum sp.]MDQ7076936.1 YerC/YecD family TrpR-related protein [Robiginitomaculum sp.]
MTNFANIPHNDTSGPDDDTEALLCALTSLHNRDELLRFLTDLCTPAELRALAARWQVAKLLDAGDLSYREISEKTGASTTTVGRVARFLNEESYQGYRIALDRVQES